MQLARNSIADHNQSLLSSHERQLRFLTGEIAHAADIIDKLTAFQVAIPSWALGTGGTRFGRFSGGGEPRSLEEKIEDIGLLHALNRSSGAISPAYTLGYSGRCRRHQAIGQTTWSQHSMR